LFTVPNFAYSRNLAFDTIFFKKKKKIVWGHLPGILSKAGSTRYAFSTTLFGFSLGLEMYSEHMIIRRMLVETMHVFDFRLFPLSGTLKAHFAHLISLFLY
jgi:hypothetical protein